MSKIDIKKIIEETKLSKKQIAENLFPSNSYPTLALTRIIKEEALLDSDQISKLALLTGRSVSQLFSGENWKAESTKGKHTFTSGEYKAVLDTDTWVTKVFHNNSLFHESVLHARTIPLDTYLEELNTIIIKNQK